MALAWRALTQIHYHNRLAYSAGDIVPDANVAAYKYDVQGLVERVTVADNLGRADGVDLVTQAELTAAVEDLVGGTAGPLVDSRIAALRNVANGLAALDATGKVPSASLPDLTGYAPANVAGKLPVRQDDIVIRVKDYGTVEDGVTNDTAAVDAAVAAAPPGSTVRFTPGANYKLTNLAPITKSLTLDLAGASFTVDPTPGTGTAGHPVFYFTGAVGAQRPIAAVGSIAATTVSAVTLTTAAHANDFKVGDVVIVGDAADTLPWNYGAPAGSVAQGVSQGYGGRYEINAVKAISGSVITLSKPVEAPYATTPTIQRMDPLYNPSIRNAARIAEVDPGAAGTSPQIGPDSGHIVHFQYCVSPVAESLHFHGWQYHAVNFTSCVAPALRDCSGRDPFRPSFGSHGYLSRLGGCAGGSVDNNLSVNCRHHLDHSGSIDATSSGNLAIGTLYGSYVMGHGLAGRRLTSISDVSLSDGPGWTVGNASFSGDFDITIINPRAYGGGAGVSIGNGSKRVRVIAPDIHVAGRGISLTTGASDLEVEGGTIEILSGTIVGPAGIMARPQQDSADTWGLPASNLRVTGTRLLGAATIQLDGMTGHVLLDDLAGDLSTTDSSGTVPVAVQLTLNHPSGAAQVTDLAICGSHLIGAGFSFGVSVASVPLNRYDIERNYVRGFTLRGFKVPAGANLREMNNTAIGANQGLEITGDLVTAKANGARVYGNSPSSLDTVVTQDVTGLGNVTMSGGSHQLGDRINAALTVRLRTNAGQQRAIQYDSGGVARWLMRVNGATEAGANVGSDFEVLGRDDNGAALSTVLAAHRKGDLAVGASTAGATLGFYGSFGTVKPAVTGSRGGNAALASLVTALAALGLLTDGTTA